MTAKSRSYAVVDLGSLCERTVTLDCDVLQADGGTRTAAITGAYVALALAAEWMLDEGIIEQNPLLEPVAAVSVGLVDGSALLDLDYGEDSRAQVDMNVVGTRSGGLVEVQGTAEGAPFVRGQMDSLLDLAIAGLEPLFAAQAAALTDER